MPIHPSYHQGDWILVEGDIQNHIFIDYFREKISNHRIRICIYLFTLPIIEEHNLIISLINNLIVLCERNQIAIGGQNNRQNLIPWLLIYYVRRLSLNQAIPYSNNQNIIRGNMILCLRCYYHPTLVLRCIFNFFKRKVPVLHLAVPHILVVGPGSGMGSWLPTWMKSCECQ
jgi:hypothetical protein